MAALPCCLAGAGERGRLQHSPTPSLDLAHGHRRGAVYHSPETHTCQDLSHCLLGPCGCTSPAGLSGCPAKDNRCMQSAPRAPLITWPLWVRGLAFLSAKGRYQLGEQFLARQYPLPRQALHRQQNENPGLPVKKAYFWSFGLRDKIHVSHIPES